MAEPDALLLRNGNGDIVANGQGDILDTAGQIVGLTANFHPNGNEVRKQPSNRPVLNILIFVRFCVRTHLDCGRVLCCWSVLLFTDL